MEKTAVLTIQKRTLEDIETRKKHYSSTSVFGLSADRDFREKTEVF
jgi:hypothetical protein